MKNSILTLLFAALAFCASAQNFNIKGKIVDDKNAGLPGANVVLQYPWGEMAAATATEPNGSFELKDVEKGGYQLVVTFLGYEDLKKELTISNKNMDLGTLQMAVGATTLGTVTVKEQVAMGKVQGDTVQYNADAFKVMKDASAQDLLEKMPTVSNESGTIKAQGENIQQVLVDGKPFFGNDPAAALKNLPAELIEKVQIFDQQSEQSQFTGVQDGNTTKTINIVTRKGMNNGQFGKVYAGYGWEDKYQAGGNTNIFKGNRRISLIGMSNNINVQNFSMDDILGVTGSGSGPRGGFGGMAGGGGRGGGGGGRGGMSGGGGASDFLVQSAGGLTTTHAFGINYADKWGKKWDVTGSYFFNKTSSESLKELTRQFVTEEGFGEVYQENSTTDADNINHRLNFRATVELDSFNSLVIRPRATWQANDGTAETDGATTAPEITLSETGNIFKSNYDGLSFSNNVLWRHKFRKPSRTFSVDVSNGYNPKIGDSQLLSTNYYSATGISEILDQQSTLDAKNWNAAANFEYTEPVSQYSQVLVNYRASYQQEESEKFTYDFWPQTQEYTLINDLLSSDFSNDYITHSGGLGYNFSKGMALNWNVRANYQWAKLANQPEFPEGLSGTEREFKNVLPSASLRFNFDRQRSIRFNYRTNTQLPSISQLQAVLDNSNPLQLSTGNPDLAQSFQHNLFARYQATNTEKSTTLFAMVGGGITTDYIGTATWLSGSNTPLFDSLDVRPGTQLRLPVNLDGYRSLRSFLNYGFPVKGIKSNLSFNLGWNYSRTPGLVNGAKNLADSHNFSAGVTLASNISPKLDFNINLRPSWNKATNTLQTASNTEYFNQNSSARLNWILIEGLVLRTDVTHQFFKGLSQGFDQNYWLWNLAIGKKLFKNERGELALAVNDLLKQNRSISRTVTETYIEDNWTNALQRFVMLSFTYNIRNFGNAPQTAPSDERRWEGRPPGF